MLRLTLLGAPQIHFDGRPIVDLLAKSQALLVYLALSKRPHLRLTLATLFWPEKGEAEALTNLRQVLYDLRRKLPDVLEATRQHVALSPGLSRWIDVEFFEQHCGAQHEIAIRDAAIALYVGDFMAGFQLAESAPFEEWVMLTRERLHYLATQTLCALMLHYSAQYDEVGLAYANRLLQLEPWNEHAHRQKMLFLAWSGQKYAALAHYAHCQKVLTTELGASPEPDTVALAMQIRDGEILPIAKTRGASPDATLRNEVQRDAQEVTAAMPEPTDAVQPAVASSASTPQPADNLPQGTTPFIGRVSEVAGVVQTLHDPHCRLLTLIGLGGIGKTRLAIEAARQAAATFPDGICFVDFTAVESVAHAPAVIAAALKLTLHNDTDTFRNVLDYLAPRTLLLVLDNLEHLADSTTLIDAVLTGAPGIKILVTSRLRLNVTAEWVFDVHGLTTPHGKDAGFGGQLSAQEIVAITQHDAVQLFMQSARRVWAAFAVDQHNAEAIVAICRMTGGMPLAIELAAGWVRVLSCNAIAQEIAENLDALATSATDIPTRQRSIHSVFASTWQLLRQHEQHVLMKLSIMRGGFDRRAVMTIGGATLPMLASLIDHAFILRHVPHRYHLHELMRQFLYQKLYAEPALLHGARAAHAHFYAAFLQNYFDIEIGAVATKLHAIEEEFENLHDAWRWLVEHWSEPMSIAWLDSMVEVLHNFFDLRSQYRTGVEWFSYAMTHLALAPAHRQDAVLLYGRVMSRLARFHYYLGNFALTAQLAAQSMQIATRHGQSGEIAFCAMRLGYLAKSAGDYSAALDHFAHALSIYQQLEDLTGATWAHNGLGLVHHQCGNLSRGRKCFHEALRLAQTLDNLMLRTVILNNLGVVYTELGEYPQAFATLQECLRLNEYLGDVEGIGYAHWGIAATLLALGQIDEAHQHSLAALDGFRSIGYQTGVANALVRHSTIAVAQQEFAEAADLLHECQWLVTHFELDEIAPLCELAFATLHLAQDQFEAAAHHAAEALTIVQRLDMQVMIARAHVVSGNVALAQRRGNTAQAHFQAALLVAQALEQVPVMIEAIAGQAYVFQQEGRDESAITLLSFVVHHASSPAAVQKRARCVLQQYEPSKARHLQEVTFQIMTALQSTGSLDMLAGISETWSGV